MLIIKKLKVILFLICIHVISYAQTDNLDFPKRYIDLRVLVNNDIPKTKIQTQLLIKDAKKSNNYEYVVKGYYMLSFAYMLEDNATECFFNAKKSYEIAKKNNYEIGQALALRAIGTQYARMNVLNIAMQNFDTALEPIKDTETEEGYEIQGLINNSKLIALGDSKKREDVLKKLKVSMEVVKSYNKLSDVNLKNNLLGSAYTNV